MSSSELTALLILSFVMSFTPGPNTMLSTAIAANRGWRAALPLIWGVPMGWALIFTLCALGLGAVLLALPQMVWLIKILGCAYLLWLGYQLLQSKRLAQADASRLQVTFWQAAALQLLNIKGWMLAVSVAAGWLLGKPEFWQRFVLLLGILMSFALISNALYAAMGASLRQWLGVGQRLAWFNRVMASVLLATAIWMLFV